MKTYVVNLPQSTDRRESILAECARFGVEAEIFPAVYGKNLSDGELRDLVDPLALGVFGKAEIGCALSHLGIYRDMVAKSIPVAFILEDDSVFTCDPRPALDELAQRVGAAGDVPEAYLLTRNRASDQMVEDGKAVRVIGGFRFQRGWRGFGAYGYVITRSAAANILALQTPVKFAADWWKVFRTFGILRFFLCETDIVGIHPKLGTGSVSLLEEDRQREKGLSRKKYTLRQTPLRHTLRYYFDKLRLGRRIKKLT